MDTLSKIKEVSRATGLSLFEIRNGMKQANTDDPVLGAGYAAAAGCAVVIKGKRHEWNMRYADYSRERILNLIQLKKENMSKLEEAAHEVIKNHYSEDGEIDYAESNPYDASGGNSDDAFWMGVRHGKYLIAKDLHDAIDTEVSE